jgi:hypothetical protein
MYSDGAKKMTAMAPPPTHGDKTVDSRRAGGGGDSHHLVRQWTIREKLSRSWTGRIMINQTAENPIDRRGYADETIDETCNVLLWVDFFLRWSQVDLEHVETPGSGMAVAGATDTAQVIKSYPRARLCATKDAGDYLFHGPAGSVVPFSSSSSS